MDGTLLDQGHAMSCSCKDGSRERSGKASTDNGDIRDDRRSPGGRDRLGRAAVRRHVQPPTVNDCCMCKSLA